MPAGLFLSLSVMLQSDRTPKPYPIRKPTHFRPRLMAHTSIQIATKAQSETVIRWLKEEHVNHLCGEGGFYCNRNIIRDAVKGSEMKVLKLGRKIIGFAVFSRRGIDIFEIRPEYRGQGHGRCFAEHLVMELFSGGSEELEVQCAPRESRHFWGKLGFVEKQKISEQPFKVILVRQKASPDTSTAPLALC